MRKDLGLSKGYDSALTQLASVIASIERKIRERGKAKAERPSDSS